jgi:hypothetical protein
MKKGGRIPNHVTKIDPGGAQMMDLRGGLYLKPGSLGKLPKEVFPGLSYLDFIGLP